MDPLFARLGLDEPSSLAKPHKTVERPVEDAGEFSDELLRELGIEGYDSPLPYLQAVSEKGRVVAREPSNQLSTYELAQELGEDRWWFDAGEDRVGFWDVLPGHPGWVVDVKFQNASVRPELHTITLTPFRRWAPADDPMTTAVWRSARPGELLKRAWARVQTNEVIKLLGRGLPPERQQSRTRPPRKLPRDMLYERATWAARYVALIETPDPIQRLHQKHGLSVSRIRNILWQARQDNLLTDAEPGRATGALTPKAERILRRGAH